MKDTLAKTADITRLTVQDLKKTLQTLKLISLMEALNSQTDDENLKINIPFFGEIEISKDFDISFRLNDDLRRDVYLMNQNPEYFLKKELSKLLKLETVANTKN